VNALKKRFSKVMLVTILSSLLLSACNPVSDRPGDIVTDTPDLLLPTKQQKLQAIFLRLNFLYGRIVFPINAQADTAIFHLMLLKKKFIIP